MNQKTIHLYSGMSETGVLPEFTQDQVKNEPMLFSCDLMAALEKGGPITRQFLLNLPDKSWADPMETLIIDSRVHMLMEGWFPCIPGWHLDDVPRTREDGQPDHLHPAYHAEHVMAVVGDASLTHFAVGSVELEEPPIGQKVYERWHYDIEREIHRGSMREIEVRDRAIVRFDWRSFHRGTMATKAGWRFFIRATRKTGRRATNELRRQTQVYLPDTNGGW